MTVQPSVHTSKAPSAMATAETYIFQASVEFDARQGTDKLVRYSDATRIGAAHGRRPVDQDASRDRCLRQRHQPGRARRASGGWGLLIGWLGYRAARFTTHRHER